MHRRQPLPRLWLMTDERQGDGLWHAIARLPRGAGIIFRHHSLPTAERRAMFDAVKQRIRGRHLLLLLAGPSGLARAWGADGSHGRGPGAGLRSAPAHSLREIRAAERAGADLIFLSPVFATRSHPGRRTLGLIRFGALARQTRLPVIALGGVDEKQAAGLLALGAYGWAGIDAWS
ncbi:MAG: thiamine phosphate synthase [Alphaproteobacteria bacterium]|nr:thiamine phosphate synthase [Alphaproteobacteria bacterium]